MNLFDVLKKLEGAGYRASEKKSEFFTNKQNGWDTKSMKTVLNRIKNSERNH